MEPVTTALETSPEANPWHARPAEDALAALDAGAKGLSAAEASARLERYGPNRLPEPEADPAWRRLLRQFHDVLIYVLLAAALVTALLGEWIDTGVILAVVVINALIGFVQEGRAEAALASLRGMLSPRAVALRDGQRRTLDAADLVPGDVVLLEAGDRVPADLRVLAGRGLAAEEAALTGESTPAAKHAEPVDEAAALGDRRSMLYAGTTVTRGQGRGLVVATGQTTEVGRIGEMIASVETLQTPLIRQINAFGKQLSVVILLAAAGAFAFGYAFRDYDLETLFLITVGLAVAAIPEGLPAILTITLALGVQRMARRRAILRRLPAVETLGSVSVICSDKTGTLTRNEMTAARVITAEAVFAVSGTGYGPEGEVSLEGGPVDPADHPTLRALGHAAILASDAVVRAEGDGWSLEGDPTEGALVALGAKLGLDRDALHDAHGRLDAIPFESEARYMATLHDHPEASPRIYVKGAPERVLAMCHRERTAEGDAPLNRERWDRLSEDVAAEGHRLLAVAERQGHAGRSGIEPEDVEEGLTLLGIVGLIDPPRPEAIEAVRACHEAGIRVKMITGDHASTARAIGAQLGIGDGAPAITGADLETLSDAELAVKALTHDVFARTAPSTSSDSSRPSRPTAPSSP
jgi:magnesium-transporting ATPase (P-type)